MKAKKLGKKVLQYAFAAGMIVVGTTTHALEFVTSPEGKDLPKSVAVALGGPGVAKFPESRIWNQVGCDGNIIKAAQRMADSAKVALTQHLTESVGECGQHYYTVTFVKDGKYGSFFLKQAGWGPAFRPIPGTGGRKIGKIFGRVGVGEAVNGTMARSDAVDPVADLERACAALGAGGNGVTVTQNGAADGHRFFTAVCDKQP